MFDTPEEKQAHLDSIHTMVRAIDQRNPCEQIMPMFFGNIGGKHTCAAIELPDDAAKDGLMYRIFNLINSGRLENGFSLMFESWVTRIPEEEKKKYDIKELMSIPGCDRPFTYEAIIVQFAHPDKEELWSSRISVVRGKRVYGDFELYQSHGSNEGRFCQLYKMAKATFN